MNPNPETSPRTAGSDTNASPDRAASAPDPVVVCIPGPLRALTDGAGEIEVRGATVAGVLERLVAEYPGLRRHLLTDGAGADGVEVRDHVNVFVNDDDVRTLDGMATTVAAGDTLTIVPSIAGG